MFSLATAACTVEPRLVAKSSVVPQQPLQLRDWWETGSSGCHIRVRLQQLHKQHYPVLLVSCGIFLHQPIGMQWRSSINSDKAGGKHPLFFFDFQLPQDLLHTWPAAHRSNMLFIFTQGTGHSIWYPCQTTRQSMVLSQGWATVSPGWTTLSPGPARMSPGEARVSPGETRVSQGQAWVASFPFSQLHISEQHQNHRRSKHL